MQLRYAVSLICRQRASWLSRCLIRRPIEQLLLSMRSFRLKHAQPFVLLYCTVLSCHEQKDRALHGSLSCYDSGSTSSRGSTSMDTSTRDFTQSKVHERRRLARARCGGNSRSRTHLALTPTRRPDWGIPDKGTRRNSPIPQSNCYHMSGLEVLSLAEPHADSHDYMLSPCRRASPRQSTVETRISSVLPSGSTPRCHLRARRGGCRSPVKESHLSRQSSCITSAHVHA